MRTFCFYSFLILVIITFQTVLFPSFCRSEYLFDFFIPLILFLGVYRRPVEGLTVIVASGLIVESLSAGPMGIYITSYFWIYSIIRWGRRFLYIGNRLFYPIIVLMGMLIQYLFVLIAFLILGREIHISMFMGSIAGQFLWGLIAGPLGIVLIRASYISWQSWFKKPLKILDS